MLSEDIAKFEKLTGHKASDYPMDYIGGFWFGYKTAKAEATPPDKWVPITMRKLTPEEIRECNERYGADIGDEALAFDCQLPEDGQEVLITTAWGVVSITTFNADPDDCYFEDYEDGDEVIAWRPLPDAYEKGAAS